MNDNVRFAKYITQSSNGGEITKRYQDQRGNEVIEDIYGNKIKFVYDSIYGVFIEPNVTVELEQLYDKLTAEVLEKVRTYGRDMEISRWD